MDVGFYQVFVLVQEVRVCEWSVSYSEEVILGYLFLVTLQFFGNGEDEHYKIHLDPNFLSHL